MENFTIYSEGICMMSVCADKKLSRKTIEKKANEKSPSLAGWRISADTHFRQGNPNPCPCEQDPENRLHWLLEC